MEAGSCSCDFDDYVELCDARKIRARKYHICDECAEVIRPGEIYQSAKWLADGCWDSQKRCIPCSSIARDYCCGMLGRGEVWAMVKDMLGVDLRDGNEL